MSGRQRGFSLVEVLIAITVIGFVTLAVAPMFVIASKSNKAAGHMGSCSALAMEQMEQLRGATLSSLVAGGSLTANVGGYSDTTNSDFDVRWLITDVVDPTNGKQIEVRAVSLRASMGPNKQVTFMSLRVP